jgi:DNA-binding NarL/FixJ family response regulator
MTLRVILGEDSYLASEGISRALSRIDGVELVATGDNLESLREAIERERPDVVVTDIRMPPTNTDEGIRLANELRVSQPETAVVVLSQYSDPQYATALLAEGSARRGYLIKEHVGDVAELRRALRTVAEGGSVVDPAVVEALVSSRRVQERSSLNGLTPRELEILALIAEGRSNAAIAATLFLTKRAVERHINGIFAKLDLGESESTSRRVRAALVYLAADAG